jgi:hypothetical protein
MSFEISSVRLSARDSDDRAITISYDSANNYPYKQNAIPVVKELLFQNDDVACKDLGICVSTEPAFAAPAETSNHVGKPAGTRVGFRMH